MRAGLDGDLSHGSVNDPDERPAEAQAEGGATSPRANEVADDDLPRPRAAEPHDVLRAAADEAGRGTRVVLATVTGRRGSSPATPGQKVMLSEAGLCIGTTGGGAVEREVLRAMVAWLRAPAAATTELRAFRLGPELGMCCGGSAQVLFEELLAAVPVLIVGAGHVAQATGPLLARCGFAVTMTDEREAWAGRAEETARSAGTHGLHCFAGAHDEAGAGVPRRAAVLVMTHDHQLDQSAVEWAVRQGFAWVGGVGSRAKAARTRTRLAHRGFAPAQIAAVRMPVGLAIGARTPDEIAVAIAAELIAWRRDMPPPLPTTDQGTT